MPPITEQSYSLEELSPRAKAKALDWGRDLLNEDFDSDQMTEDLQEYVKEKYGLVTDKCYWGLGHCQGDGVAFYGNVDLRPLAEKHPELDAVLTAFRLANPENAIWANIGGENGHYHHWNSMIPSVEHDVRDRENRTVEAHADETAAWVQDWLENTLQEISRDAERYGYEIVDDRNSDEYITEFIEGNEYRFDEDGERIE